MRGLTVENFCGGGGVSTGIGWALGRSVDIAINHSKAAIAMHMANHPNTLHYCESVFDVDPIQVTAGKPVDLLWSSPDCTHFSKARGNTPVKKEIRGLAWVKVRWAIKVKPLVMMLENVEEFKTWGPLLDIGNGYQRPDPTRVGETFDGFVKALSTGLRPNHPAWTEAIRSVGIEFDVQSKLKLFKGLGYKVEFKTERFCDYGAPTIRKRLAMVARCDGRPIVWPQATHGAPHDQSVISGKMKPWVTAAKHIDFSLPCHSIFMTKEMAKQQGLKIKRPLADATLERIAIGTVKHVLENPSPFIIEIANWSNKSTRSIHEPIKTITASPKGGAFALVSAFMVHLRKSVKPTSMLTPMPTITAGGTHHAQVQIEMVEHGESGLTAEQEAGAVRVSGFLMRYYSNGGQWSSLSTPSPTITTKDRIALVTVTWNKKTMVITDIGLRMLTPRELFNLQGFPPDYIIDNYGCKTTTVEQVARVGNSVPPQYPEALVRANLPELCTQTAEAA